ncbi:MAG TPA: hypothetical protein VFX25_28245 [Streptosporangiaceae bacterium]|jgi:hypothetical protein|nr:hypothetical protein [Streptosporangiaceae bacterium]
MGKDLHVSLDLLESTAGSLSMLMEEFKDASAIVNDYHGAIGEPALISALDDFAGNWQVHRQQLLQSMQAVYDMVTKSHQAYVSTDDNLAHDIKTDAVAPVAAR